MTVPIVNIELNENWSLPLLKIRAAAIARSRGSDNIYAVGTEGKPGVPGLPGASQDTWQAGLDLYVRSNLHRL